MAEITTIGLDIAKSVFQVHGVDAAGQVVVRRQLRRSHVLRYFAGLAPCVVGVEACATSHYWSRQLQALGHIVKLMPPSYVKPYVKRQKNDMADAEAICEAVMRPTMRFVETKTPEQQSVLMLHRIRLMLVGQRTMLSNTLRAHMAEFGIVVAEGPRHVSELVAILANPADERIPAPLHDGLVTIVETLRAQYPGQVVLVDAGDLLQGTLLATYYGREHPQRPHPIVDALNPLQYDAATPGNHDFDFGADLLLQASSDATYRYVSANIVRGRGGDTLVFPAATVVTRNGVKIAITGLTTPGVMVWDRAQLSAPGIRVRSLAAAAPQALSALAGAGADFKVERAVGL